MNLRGRTELELTAVEHSETRVNLEQVKGPLQLVHLDSGLLLLEIPQGRRHVTLAVPPGHYLARRTNGRKRWAKEFSVAANAVTVVHEEELALIGSTELTAKSGTNDGWLARSEFMASFVLDGPRYRASYQTPHFNAEEQNAAYAMTHSSLSETTCAVAAGYMLRTHTYLSTKIQAGLVLSGNRLTNYEGGGVLFRVGELAGLPLAPMHRYVPLVGTHIFEPYAVVQLTSIVMPWAITTEGTAHEGKEFQLSAGAAFGLRIAFLYTQFGLVMNVVPYESHVNEVGGVRYGKAYPGWSLESGVRLRLDG
jgi:hypothetical protein